MGGPDAAADAPVEEATPPAQRQAASSRRDPRADHHTASVTRLPPDTESPTDGPRIVETAAVQGKASGARADAVQGALKIDNQTWTLPALGLLQSPAQQQRVVYKAEFLRENARVLEEKLADFKIAGEVTDIRPGPVVTTYEYKPAPGVKISKIANLRDDLTMSLKVLNVRIVAPIPGRDVVGIEVPNEKRQFVYFRELAESEAYRGSHSPLSMILGKDIEGRPVVTDLAKAPHMLVAGATGSGKSVGINSFICTMLYKSTPEDVRFILIDPKRVELSSYQGIPHLLVPVIDEPEQAELALKWTVREMERRYQLLADARVRSIKSYKDKLPELRAAALRKRAEWTAAKRKGTPLGDPNSIDVPTDLPHIVVVIDEFADLIMVSGKEVERAVARLAQKARAAGIHVILATQRPSTDVITGLIKANFPTRLSFRVSSAIDSKVILDQSGADALLGNGDMLFLPNGQSHLRRCHGTFLSDDEVIAVAEHWKSQGEPQYEMDILRDPAEEEAAAERAAAVADEQQDTLYEDAVKIVVEAQQVSVSYLQRRLGIGYGRSARIVDFMEARGVIGPPRGPNKPRDVLIQTVDQLYGDVN
jgi:S-DNA-T family DNA segregation ATPase FtsK/SpoIIIE